MKVGSGTRAWAKCICALLLAARAAAADVATDSVHVAHGASPASWREAARTLPGVATRAHDRADVPYGPALYSRVAPHAVLDVRFGELSLVDPWSGHAVLELAPEAIARLERAADGSLRIVPMGADDAPRISASAASEAVTGALPGFAATNRERYAATLVARRTGERGTLELFGTQQARWFGDRAPRFVDEPYPGTASASLGGAAFDDRRKPGDALAGSSGVARLAWTSAQGEWRASVSGAQSHDDWREYRHTYLMNMAHTPRVTQDFDAGAVAFERHGHVQASLHGTLAKSAWHRGDGVLFDRFDDWVRDEPGSPRYDSQYPYFYSPGHIYGAIEKHQAVRGEATLDLRLTHGRERWRSTGLQFAWRQWALHRYHAISGGEPVTWEGYGYDERGETDNLGTRHVYRFDAAIASELRPGADALLTIEGGVAWVHRPGEERPAQLGDVDTTGSRYLPATYRTEPVFAIDGQGYIARAIEWSCRLAREVPELPGEHYAQADDAALAAQWEMSADARLGDDQRGRTRVAAHLARADEAPFGPRTRRGRSNFHDGAAIELGHERAWSNGLAVAGGVAWSRVRAYWRETNQRNIAWSSSSAPDVRIDTDDSRTWEGFLRCSAQIGAEPRRAWWADAHFRVASGAPYSPTRPYDEVTLSATSPMPSGDVNSRRLPWAVILDLGASKGFALAGLRFEAALRVLNVLDRHNVVEVWSGTGRPDDTGWLETEDGRAWLDMTGEGGRSLHQLAQHDPTHWGPPRTLTLSLCASY